MAKRQKRLSSSLSSRSASDSHKRRCTGRGDRNSELPDLPSTTADNQGHGGLPETPGAPKLDEALDLSPTGMSEADPGTFGDIPMFTSLDHSLPSPEREVSKIPDEPRLMHQGDHLPSMMGTLCLEEPLQFPHVRRDYQHHEPAFVGPGLDTVVVPRYQTHAYFWEQYGQNVPTASLAAHEQHDPYHADDEKETKRHAWSLRSQGREARHLHGARDRPSHSLEAHQSFTPRTPSDCHTLRRQAPAGHLGEAYELQALVRMSYVQHWVEQVAVSSSNSRYSSQTGLLGGTVVAGRSFKDSVRAESLREAWWCRCV